MDSIANLPAKPGAFLNKSVTEIQLPALYQAARTAIEKCCEIDECKEWADKAAALKAYAAMRDDAALRNYADRIHLRSVRQMGLLLKQIEPQQGGDRGNSATGGRPPVGSRKAAAEAAGLSEHQRKTALRVANVPESEFTRHAESETAPTVTALAAQGTAKGPQSAPRPPVCEQLGRFADYCERTDPIEVAQSITARDAATVSENLEVIALWLETFRSVFANADAAPSSHASQPA